MLEVVEVKTRKDLRRFIRFPDRLYKGCAQYVPALHSEEMHSLTDAASLHYCNLRLWMVYDGSKPMGRIGAMINPRYNELYGRKYVRFGWFDCVNDIEVARLLFDAATQWARGEGMVQIHGPLQYDTLGKQGMMVEGYEHVPPFNCPYNFPYYNDLVTALGFVKECDWLQYKVVANHGVPEKARRVAKMVMERYPLHLGNLDELGKDPEQIRNFFRLVNESLYDEVYHFVPFTAAEIEEQVRKARPFISDKASCVVLDADGRMVAFGISFPSRSAALQKAGGHLFPFGWLHLKLAMRRYETTDLLVSGAVPEWRNTGISAIYYKEMADKAARIGNRWAITSPQVESSSAVNIWNSYEREPYMRRRCYIKNI